jgi:hypothetical protein
VTRIANFLKNKDWAKVEEEFNELVKHMDKNKATTQHGIPRIYVRVLAQLEDDLATSLKESKVRRGSWIIKAGLRHVDDASHQSWCCMMYHDNRDALWRPESSQKPSVLTLCRLPVRVRRARRSTRGRCAR